MLLLFTAGQSNTNNPEMEETMALKAYKDPAFTQEIREPQMFADYDSRDGGHTIFTLTKMLGTEFDRLFRFNGDDYVQLTSPVDYTLVGQDITLYTGLEYNEHIIAEPVHKLDLFFGGDAGELKTSVIKIYLRAEGGNLVFGNMRVIGNDFLHPTASQLFANRSLVATPNQTLNGKIGTLITGLAPDAQWDTDILVDQALIANNNKFLGTILANNATSVLITPINGVVGINNDGTDLAEITTTSSFRFRNGDIGAFVPVLMMGSMSVSGNIGPSTYELTIRDTVILPATPSNMPDKTYKLTAIQFTE